MARPDVFYVIPFQNPENDPHPHVMVVQFDPDANLRKRLERFLHARPNLRINLDQKFESFPTQPQATDRANAMKDQWNAANPERVGAEQQFDVPNRLIEQGKEAAQAAVASGGTNGSALVQP